MKYCPYCCSIVDDSHRCGAKPRPKRKPTEGDATRGSREPWRSSYGRASYQAARQQVIARQGGRCAVCGRQCAKLGDGRWLTAGMGGEVHHERALCDGGSNDAGNLVLVCKSCHKRLDDARRAHKNK